MSGEKKKQGKIGELSRRTVKRYKERAGGEEENHRERDVTHLGHGDGKATRL